MSLRISATACAMTATGLLAWALMRAPAPVRIQAGEGISVGGAMQGSGSTASPLGLVGGSGTSGRQFVALGSGSAAFGNLTASHDSTITGTGAPASPLAVVGGLEVQTGLGLFFTADFDGACFFDGTDLPAGATRSGSTYTLTRDAQCSTLMVSPGIRVFTANWRMFASVEMNIYGTIDNNGRDATASAAGASQAAGYFAATRAGANQGVQLTTATNLPPWYPTRSNGSVPLAPYGNGGSGTTPGQGGGGGASAATNGTYVPGTTPLLATQGGASFYTLWRGRGDYSTTGTTQFVAAQGGSGGALVAANAGGFGGAAGGIVWLASPKIYGTGTISAKGGAGSSRAAGFNGGGGGGGGGGMLILFYNTRSASLTLSVAGGAGGLGENGGASGGNGGSGATGTQYLMNMSGDGT